MKKLMALVLALVMTLGLATVGSNAAYNDESKISLNEAVDVMSAVGVFKGSYGNFDPNGNLTREQAAKLIAYLDLGEKAAEALPAIQVFDDVDASRWSAKYVAYCQDAGYVGGVGNNKYDPAGNLTGYAFGKMILCVLGYDAHIEGLTGASWTINVAKLMEKNDINDGVSAAPSEILTREQGAQYCLNALKADMVEYENKGTSIEINGATIATGASKASKVANTKAKDYRGENAADADLVMQLCEKLYKTDLKFGTTGDDFKAPANKWTYKSSEVGTYADSADATYTNKVTKATIYNLLGKDVVDDLNNNKAKLYVFVDGEAQQVGNNAYDDVNFTKNNSAAAFGTSDGMYTEVYIKDDGVEDQNDATLHYALVRVVIKNTYLLQATADYNAKTEKLNVKTVVVPAGFNVNSLDADDFSVADYKEDDYILCTVAKVNNNWELQTIEKAELVSGKVSARTVGKNVTIDGTKYVFAKKADAGSVNTAFEINDTAKIVVDKLGKILYVDDAAVSSDDIVFVINAAKNGFDVQAKIVTIDGTKRTVTVDTDDSQGKFSKAETNGAGWDYKEVTSNGRACAWAYELDGSEYEMSEYNKQFFVNNAEDEYALKLNKVTSLGNNYTANSKTVYIVADADDDITLYTGVKNAPDFYHYEYALATTDDDDVAFVFIKYSNDGDMDDSSETDELVYILKKGDTIKGSDKKEYTEYEALVNGVKTTLKDRSGDFTVGQLYKSVKTNTDGYVTNAVLINPDNYDHDDYKYGVIADASDAFGYSDGVFTVKFSNAEGDKDSGFVKTDKAYIVAYKSDADNTAIMDDDNATYELTETTFAGLKNFVKGYDITGNVWVTLNSDEEITAAYVTINASQLTPAQQ